MSKVDDEKPGEWSSSGMALKVIKHGSLSYDRITRATAQRGSRIQTSTVLYDSLALRYNQSEPGDLIMVALPNRPNASNLRKIIMARGLDERDFRLFQPLYDESGQPYPKKARPMVLQRITDAAMKTVQPYPAIAARLAKEAEERGQTFDFAHPENLEESDTSESFSAENQELTNT